MGLRPRLVALNRVNTLVASWPIQCGIVPYGSDRGVFAAIEAHAKPAPSGLEMVAAVLNELREFPRDQLLVAGHASPDGATAHNQTLSELRAESLELYTKGDRDGWASHAAQNQRVSDLQVAMAGIAQMYGWPCLPGPIDDIMGPKTKAGIESFRQQYNTTHDGSLAIDASFGGDDWKAVAHLYDEKLAGILEIDLDELASLRGAIVWCTPAQLGYGETHPLTSIVRAQPDDFASLFPDRRAELLVVPEGLDLPLLAGAEFEHLYASRWLTFHTLTPAGKPFDVVVRLVPDPHGATGHEDTLVLLGSDGSKQTRALLADCTDCTEYLETTFEGIEPGKAYSLGVECSGRAEPEIIFADVRGFALRGQTIEPPPDESQDDPEPEPEDDPSTVGEFIEGAA